MDCIVIFIYHFSNSSKYNYSWCKENKKENIGLSVVYTAVVGSICNLNEFYSVPKGKVKQFEQMPYYAHGSGNTVNGDFDVAIPEGTNGKFQYIRGSNKYKDKLKPEK